MKPSERSQRFARMRRQLTALGDLAPRPGFAFDLGPVAKDEYYLKLPFRRSAPAIAIGLVFLSIFSYPLVGVLGSTGHAADGSLFSLVLILFNLFWALGWTVGVVIIAAVVAVMALGRETLRVRQGSLILRAGIPGIGFGAVYPGSLIRNFRRGEAEPGSGSSWRGHHLVFDFAGEPLSFGSNIDAAKAETVLAELRRRFPSHADALTQLPEATAAADKPEPQRRPPAAGKHGLGSGSTLALLVANLFPLVGVLLADWDIGEIMLLYWAESAVIGFYNLLKMLRIDRWSSLLFGPFFIGHYGAFMAVHLLFIYVLFGSSFGSPESDIQWRRVLEDLSSVWPVLLAFLISHGVSFVQNFLGRQEYLSVEMSTQMGEPYKRIMVMHLTIIFGGFLVMAVGSTLPALLLMVLLKTATDARAHLRQHAESS